jgi:hypothetical protein
MVNALLVWDVVHGTATRHFAGHLPSLVLSRESHVEATLLRISVLFRTPSTPVILGASE